MPQQSYHSVNTPDGKTINFPASMSDADINTAMQKLYPPQGGGAGTDITKQMQSIPQGDVLKQAAREALPYAGATAASLAAGPEAGIAARMGIAALGGAAGSVASHAVPGGNQPPLLSGAGAVDVGEDAVKQAVIELGAGLVGKAVGGLVSRFTSRVPVEEAAAKIADSIHPEITPAEFGDTLRTTVSKVRDTLGQQKGQVLNDIISEFPIGKKLPSGEVVSLSLNNTKQVVNQAINTLQAEKKLTPSLFAAGEAKSRTLAVLQDMQKSLVSTSPGTETVTSPILDQFGKAITEETPLPIPPHYQSIKDLDTLRSNLFKMGQGIDRSLPKTVVSQITHAVHNDIGATLKQFGEEGEAAFARFENASSTFRKVADTLDTSTFKRIMKDNVNQPEKVLNILMQAPETNIGDLAVIIQHAPNGRDILASMEHLALEKAASSSRLLDSIPEPARRVVFGKNLPMIEEFFSKVESPKAGMSMLSQAAIHAGGVVGGGVAGEVVGHPLLGMGTGATIARWLVRSGTETATISSTQLAALLGNSSTRQLLLRAAETPASSKAAGLIMRALGAYLEYPEPQGNPTPFEQPQPTGGATIGDQLKSKGVNLPVAQPNTPGLPFHPGAGLR